jgi:hypothetical protein
MFVNNVRLGILAVDVSLGYAAGRVSRSQSRSWQYTRSPEVVCSRSNRGDNGPSVTRSRELRSNARKGAIVNINPYLCNTRSILARVVARRIV